MERKNTLLRNDIAHRGGPQLREASKGLGNTFIILTLPSSHWSERSLEWSDRLNRKPLHLLPFTKEWLITNYYYHNAIELCQTLEYVRICSLEYAVLVAPERAYLSLWYCLLALSFSGIVCSVLSQCYLLNPTQVKPYCTTAGWANEPHCERSASRLLLLSGPAILFGHNTRQ